MMQRCRILLIVIALTMLPCSSAYKGALGGGRVELGSMRVQSERFLVSAKRLGATLATAVGLGVFGNVPPAAALGSGGEETVVGASMSSAKPSVKVRSKYRPRAYSIEFTSPPTMQPRSYKGEASLLQRFSNARILLVGINSDNANSVEFTAGSFLDRLITAAGDGGKKEVVLSLDNSMPSETRATFEALAKKKSVKLLESGVDSATVSRVAVRGFEGLTDEDRSLYVPDPQDFVASVTSKGFKRYADNVIVDNYKRAGQRLVKEEKSDKDMPSSEKFFASQILENEGTAATLAKSAAGSRDRIVVLVADSTRVKFGYGVKERSQKLLRVVSGEDGGTDDVMSVLIDPTPEDTLSETAQLRLTLAYGSFLDDQRPLADFIWFSEEPPLRVLTRTKNPIGKEGDKPAGESSVIGAFNARK